MDIFRENFGCKFSAKNVTRKKIFFFRKIFRKKYFSENTGQDSTFSEKFPENFREKFVCTRKNFPEIFVKNVSDTCRNLGLKSTFWRKTRGVHFCEKMCHEKKYFFSKNFQKNFTSQKHRTRFDIFPKNFEICKNFVCHTGSKFPGNFGKIDPQISGNYGPKWMCTEISSTENFSRKFFSKKNFSENLSPKNFLTVFHFLV